MAATQSFCNLSTQKAVRTFSRDESSSWQISPLARIRAAARRAVLHALLLTLAATSL